MENWGIVANSAGECAALARPVIEYHPSLKNMDDGHSNSEPKNESLNSPSNRLFRAFQSGVRDTELGAFPGGFRPVLFEGCPAVATAEAVYPEDDASPVF
ncbi:hypothetical protein SAMN05421858_2145 [Haladaptatus litoreus]|uniref:Uncharacterized protein n=1 Tax=Haladaptatus litoreus TaxID=553468 RepID=A0A1N6ZS73_9EURY|nr:hypothetical protein SAMN05421858_2145 [Haladaptatus litoreus]